MTLRRLHRLNAALLGVFLALHLGNHLALIGGHATHTAVMEALRLLYRNTMIEPVLIALFAAQIVLGLILIRRRGWPANRWAKAQVASGGVLAAFLVAHVSTVLATRMTTDTGTGFAATVVSGSPQMWFFIPYYIAAVTALATHLAAALRFARWPAARGALPRLLPIVGLAAGVVIVLGLRGTFNPG